MIESLAKTLKEREAVLEKWWREKTAGLQLPITCSVDIRNAGYKIAGIDTNLFPAGFNNFCNAFQKGATTALQDYILKYHPKTKKILLIPESFTRNLNYFKNVKTIQTMLENGGFEVRVGFVGDPLPGDPHSVPLPDFSSPLEIFRTIRNGNRLSAKGFDPDLIFLNNDCSAGIPESLLDIAQPITPNPELGWHARSKYHHFQLYCQLLREWAGLMDMDGWRFCPISQVEENIDVDRPEDLQRLAAEVKKLLTKIQQKYDQYGIPEKPFVFIKDNAGTFGMGVLPVESAEEVLALNRKRRKQLTNARTFLLQEGIPTIDHLQGAPVEPVFYFVGEVNVGGFFRIHADKDNRSSLNAPGAKFDCLCVHKTSELAPQKLDLHCKSSEQFFKVAEWVGKIACLAAGLEEKELLG